MAASRPLDALLRFGLLSRSLILWMKNLKQKLTNVILQDEKEGAFSQANVFEVAN